MMKSPLRLWIVVLAGIPLAGLGFLIVAGLFLPPEHRVASRASYPVTPDSLWAVVSDFPGAAAWRPDVTRMERLPDRNGHPVWLEVGVTGELPFEILESQPPSRLVTRIADPELPFGGRWIYRIEASAGGARLTITEEGRIVNPVFRSVARFFFGFHSTIDGYLRSLGARLGIQVVPEHLAPEPDSGLEAGS